MKSDDYVSNNKTESTQSYVTRASASSLPAFFRIIVFIACPFIFASCSTMASVISGGMRVAGTFGVIDKTVAYAVADSTEAIGKAAEEFTPEQQYYIGRAVGASLLTSYTPYRDPFITKYLNNICMTIVINSPRPELYNGYRVLVLDTDEINAFATSGGHIFVTRGMLECANSEDALAAVIAHEIAHIQLDHSLNAIRTSRIAEAVAVTSQSALSVVAEQQNMPQLTLLLDDFVTDIVRTLVNKGYSKSQEYDADNKALTLLASSGYDPNALVNMLKLLKSRERGHSGGLIDTHPKPDDRIKKVSKTLKNFPPAVPPQVRQERFNLYMAGL